LDKTDVLSVKLIGDKAVLRAFPDHLFFDVRFNYDYGVPLGMVKGSACWVVQKKDNKATQLGRLGEADVGVLKKFMRENLSAAKDDATLKDALRGCLRISQEALTEHGWMKTTLVNDSLKAKAEGRGKTAAGTVAAKPEGGYTGDIVVTLRVEDGKGRAGEVVSAGRHAR